MSYIFEPLIPARLVLRASGVPFSERYDDAYHGDVGALPQARHVFLQGNQLPARWRRRDTFTVCETGFGLGQNFLATWHAWRSDPARSRRLHMVSFEAHPFSRGDLKAALLASLPDSFKSLAMPLVDAWPPLTPGLHRLEFDGGAVTLTLAFGPIRSLARQVEAAVDAFYLDGFSPRKNPEMWTPSVFGQLVRMANAGATLATWCSAGSVRRALADAGFLVSKVPGPGRKWAMTVATLRPNMGRGLPLAAPSDSVLIIGGGLAGAGIAHSLSLRGLSSVVVDPVFARGLGASHAGHRAAALTPLLSKDDDIRARLSRAGTLRALQRWQPLPEPARPVRCGTLELAVSEQEAHDRQKTIASLSFPADWAVWLDSQQASERAGFKVDYGGVFFAHGQLVRPEPLIETLLVQPGVRCVAAQVESLEHSQGRWLARDAFGAELARASTVVLANAAQARALLSATPFLKELPAVASMQNLAGQVSYFDAAAAGRHSESILAGDGYWLPAMNYVSVGGSTYVPDATDCALTQQGHHAVIGKMAALLSVSPAQAEAWHAGLSGWAGWRAVATGRLPVIGPLTSAPGLWLACAYGSRGLTWSALAADVICAQLSHEPLMLERGLLRSIAPR